MPDTPRIKELRGELVTTLDEIQELATETEAVKVEEYERAQERADELEEEIGRHVRAEEAREKAEEQRQLIAEGSAPSSPQTDGPDSPSSSSRTTVITEDQMRTARAAFMRAEMSSIPQEVRSRVHLEEIENREYRIPWVDAREGEQRNVQISGNQTDGGILIAPAGQLPMLEARSEEGTLRGLPGINEIQTATGAPIPIPHIDTTSLEGEEIGEEMEASKTKLEFKHTNLRYKELSSKEMSYKWNLLRDAAVDLDSLVVREQLLMIERYLQRVALLGGGTFKGLLPQVAVGHTADLANDLGYDDIVGIVEALSEVHDARAVFLFRKSTRKNLRLIKDTTGRPIYQAGMTDGPPATLLEKNFRLHRHMPEIAAGSTPILFGSFGSCWFRKAGATIMLRMDGDENKRKKQTGFITYEDHDFLYADPGDEPLIKLQMNT